jgi:hypothetical protein
MTWRFSFLGQTDFTDAASLPPRDSEVLVRFISTADPRQLLVQIANCLTEEIKR